MHWELKLLILSAPRDKFSTRPSGHEKVLHKTDYESMLTPEGCGLTGGSEIIRAGAYFFAFFSLEVLKLFSPSSYNRIVSTEKFHIYFHLL